MNDLQDTKLTANINFTVKSVKKKLICEGLKLLGTQHPDMLTNIGADSGNRIVRDVARKSYRCAEIKLKIKGVLVKRLHYFYKSLMSFIRKTKI